MANNNNYKGKINSKYFQSLQTVLSERSEDRVEQRYYEAVEDWRSWWQGYNDNFHTYNRRRHNQNIQIEKRTMSPVAILCRGIKKLLINEKFEIMIDDDIAQEAIERVFEENNFLLEFIKKVERIYALGSIAIIEYPLNGKTCIDFIDNNSFIPLAWRNNNISKIVTISQSIKSDGESKIYYNLLTFHEKMGNDYNRVQELYKSTSVDNIGKRCSMEELFDFGTKEMMDIENGVIMEGTEPFFQIASSVIEDNIDFQSPLGISVIANSIDTLRNIDEKYDSYNLEFKNGTKKIFVTADAIKTQVDVDDETGAVEYRKYFDSNEEVFEFLPIDGENMTQPVVAFDTSLRVNEHISAINHELDILTTQAGLGPGFITFDSKGMMTATQVKADKSDAWQFRNLNLVMIKKVMTGVIKSVLYIEQNILGNITNVDIDNLEITYKFDESLIADDEQQRTSEREDVLSGIMPKIEYLKRNYKLTESEAREWLKKVDEEKKTVDNVDFFGEADQEMIDKNA